MPADRTDDGIVPQKFNHGYCSGILWLKEVEPRQKTGYNKWAGQAENGIAVIRGFDYG